MTRLLELVAVVAFVCFPLDFYAQETVEIANVQLANSLSAVVEDPNGSPIPNVLVEEFNRNWIKSLRSTKTDATGKFSLSTVNGRSIYYLKLTSYGFAPLEVRVQVDRKRGKNLKLTLNIAT